MPPKPVSGTVLIHGDASVSGGTAEVAPSISVSTTFLLPAPTGEPPEPIDPRMPSRHVYSRYTQQVSTRVEHILGKISGGYAVTYASGLAAAYSALVHFQPKRIAIRGGYFGCHETIRIYQKSRGHGISLIDLDDEFKPGDLCWLETPVNPTGESRDMKHYANKIHAVGGILLVDSTFGPPPLQYPFNFGADIILYSATKYFGGHSDLLAGVLVVKTEEQWTQLQHDRTYLGSMMGSLESWLLLRSLRTFHLRIPRQSETATKLAQWLHGAAGKSDTVDGIPGGVIAQVCHSSLQPRDARGFDPKSQMTGGWNATFSILLADPKYATELPHSLRCFVPATSLGGVESLIEHRVHADPSSDPRLLRISVGVEEFEDLKEDLKRGLQKVSSKVSNKL